MTTTALAAAPPNPEGEGDVVWRGLYHWQPMPDQVVVITSENEQGGFRAFLWWPVHAPAWTEATWSEKERILAAWAVHQRAVAAAERTLRLAREKHAYIGLGVFKVARCADVINAENALLALGVKPT